MKRTIAALALFVAFAGCKHDDIWDGWDHIKIPEANYDYYMADVQSPTAKSTLYVFLPGYGNSHESDASRKVQKCLKKHNKSGILIAPRIEHKKYQKETLSMAIKTANSIQHGNTVLVGISAGAVMAMASSFDFNADSILAVVAGAYKKAGGQPTDWLNAPSCRTWYLNGYDEQTLEKYGIYWDGTVFADPTIKAYDVSPAGSKMTMFPGYSHGDAVKMMTDEAVLWLDE